MATKIKNIPFVGGDTATFEFDFGTKVVDSVAECPLKIYGSRMSAIQLPANITGNNATGWQEINSGYAGQAFIDKSKTLDGQCTAYSSSTNGIIAQLLVELDLTALCTALFGGSTSAMQTALKSITLNAWARGSGATGNKLTAEIWGAYSNVWALATINYTNSISNLSIIDSNNDGNNAGHAITSANKVYFHFYAPVSDGTIPSEVDLDYVNIKLQFARVPDVIAPIPITLPDTWSILVKGFSPAYSSDDLPSADVKYITTADNFDNANSTAQLSIRQDKTFKFGQWSGSALTGCTVPASFKKFQCTNFLIEQTLDSLRLRCLTNGGTVQKSTLSNPIDLSGNKKFYLLKNSSGYQADAFLNSIIFMPNKTFDDDTEAEAVLRGTAIGFEEDELFDINKLVTNSYCTVDTVNKTFTINATSAWHGQTIVIPILPNNQYHFECKVDVLGVGYTRIDAGYNTIDVKLLVSSIMSAGTCSVDFTTPEHCNQVSIWLTNNAPGTVTFSDISLKLKM